MAVTVRAPFPAGTAGDIVAASTTLTTSVTLLAGDDLELHVAYDKASDTGVTLSPKLDPTGANLSPDGSSTIVHANGASVGMEQVFWWLNSSLSAAGLLGAGAKNLTTTASTSADSMEQKAYALTGADHNAPSVTTAVGSSGTAAVTSASCPTNGLALGHFVGGSSFTATNNTNTLLQSGTSGNAGWNIAGNTAAGAGATISLTGTLPADFWGAIATVWAPAGAAPAVQPAATTQHWPALPGGPWPLAQTVLDPGTNFAQAVPIGIDSGEVFGVPAAAQNVTVSPSGIASGEAFGTPIRVTALPVIVGASADNTHFIDQYGNPRLFVCEDAWNLLAGGGAWNSGNYQSTYDTYFSQRAAQGYTAVEVSWCSYINTLSALPHTDGSDWDAVFPFSTNMDPSTTPNSTFWARRDYFLSSAANNGITVVMNVTTPSLWNTSTPQYSWTNTQWSNFGTFLGNRYKTTPNILWITGDDYFGDVDAGIAAMLTALRATGDTHLISMQLYQEATSRQDIYTLAKDPLAFSVHSQYEWGYSYNVSYDVVEKGQIYTPTGSDDVQGVTPVVWGDGRYLSTSVGSGQTDDRLERQMIWWALASGACGFSTGDDNIWVWASSSPAAVTGRTFYTSTMPAIAAAFRGLTNWQKLLPDTSSQLVTAGRGTHASPIVSGGSGTYYIANTDNYVTASRSPDTGSGSALAVIYCGLAMNITIDQTKMAAGYTVTWLDPINGATYAGTPGSTYNSATARGNNSGGDPDWVLVLAASSSITISPTGIASTEAFGSATATSVLTVNPSGIASAEAFGTATQSNVLVVSPTGIASAEQFGTSTEGSVLTVQPAGIATAEGFGVPAVSTVLTVSPTGIASAEAFGTAAVSAVLQVAPTGIGSAEAFGTASTGGVIATNPTGIATAEAFGTAAASMGALTVSPTGVTSAEAFGTLGVGSVLTVQPTGVASGETFGVPTRTSTLTVSPTGIATGEAVGTPVVGLGSNPQPTGILSAEQWGTAAVTTTLTVQPSGIGTGQQFGAVVVSAVLGVGPTGIVSSEAWGLTGAASTLVLAPNGVSSGESWGTPIVVGGVPTNLRDITLAGRLLGSRFGGVVARGRLKGEVKW